MAAAVTVVSVQMLVFLEPSPSARWHCLTQPAFCNLLADFLVLHTYLSHAVQCETCKHWEETLPVDAFQIVSGDRNLMRNCSAYHTCFIRKGKTLASVASEPFSGKVERSHAVSLLGIRLPLLIRGTSSHKQTGL